MNARLTAGALAAACGVVLLASCSSGGQSTSSGQSASTPSAGASSATSPAGSTPSASTSSSAAAKPAATVKITIKDFKYQVPSSVKPGEKITITNSVNHTVTSDKAGVFNTVVPSGGGTATITAPTTPGKYPFHCKYHANMHGTLVVS